MRENKAKKTKIPSKKKGRGAFRYIKKRFFRGGIFVEIQDETKITTTHKDQPQHPYHPKIEVIIFYF